MRLNPIYKNYTVVKKYNSGSENDVSEKVKSENSGECKQNSMYYCQVAYTILRDPIT